MNSTILSGDASRRRDDWEPPKTDSRPIAVLGGGVLGRRIAATWVAAGYNVILCDLSQAQRNAAAQYIDHSLPEYRKRLEPNQQPGNYTTVPNIESAVVDAWLIIEALPEKLALKIDCMGVVDQNAPHDSVVGTNSSSFKSSMMLEKVDPRRRCRMLNTHYYMPPENSVVELMTCGETDPNVLAFLKTKLEQAGMIPAIARKESTGFIFNRLWAAIKRETLLILAEGVSDPKEIDQLFTTMFKNNPLGPCGMMDAVGLDTVAFIEDNYISERSLASKGRDWLQEHYIDHGMLGAKSGKGGLYPPGETTRSRKEDAGHHDNLAAPQLYLLDVGMGGDADPNHLGPSGKVLTASADGSQIRELITDQEMPDGIDVSIPAGKIFWTNMGMPPSENNGSVMSANLDGSNTRTIIPQGEIHTPKQIIVEPETDKLYICDREGLRVHRCNFDGSGHEVIVQRGDFTSSAGEDATNWCVGIAVDVSGGKFYWTQKGPSKGGKGRIFRANLNMPIGETATSRSDVELVLDHLPEPIDLEFSEGKLYWTDRGEYPLGNTLNLIDIYGNGKTTKTLARHFHEAIGIKIDHINHHIYMTDLGGTVYRFNMDGSDKRKVYDTDSAYTGIALTHM